jgi:hypothetical protein
MNQIKEEGSWIFFFLHASIASQTASLDCETLGAMGESTA